MKLELTKSHLWLILKGIAMLTSEEGERKLLEEFPDLDAEALEQDLHELCDKLERLKP